MFYIYFLLFGIYGLLLVCGFYDLFCYCFLWYKYIGRYIDKYIDMDKINFVVHIDIITNHKLER